ncbi:hypothetical protein D0469_17150 [Peribacillus saganii]|uniref:Uncharacterized protein n=1 Tax=Peribacillus saganii TaxID=2303992 RepID=A0A372LJ21_9BACI|nr:hypothetical protein D0469_17150 [Peribacillus saganii]
MREPHLVYCFQPRQVNRSKIHPHFLVRCLFGKTNSREKRINGDPAAQAGAEEAPEPPAGSEYLERKPTGMFNKA